MTNLHTTWRWTFPLKKTWMDMDTDKSTTPSIKIALWIDSTVGMGCSLCSILIWQIGVEWTKWTCLMKTLLTVSISAQYVSKHTLKFCVLYADKYAALKATLTDLRKLDILLLCAGNNRRLRIRRCWCIPLLGLFCAKQNNKNNLTWLEIELPAA